MKMKIEKLCTLLFCLKCSAKKDGGGDEENSASRKPLSDASVLLLLVLTNHCTDQVRITFDAFSSNYILDKFEFYLQESLKNPYRSALFRCAGMIKKDEDEKAEKADGGAATSSEEVSFRIDFPRLFTTLSSTLSTDESTLLLYLLLHQNAEFRSHVLASSDVEKVSGEPQV